MSEPEVRLVREFPPEAMAMALDGWGWLDDLAGLTPWFASPFGDLFLVDDSESIWYLDLIEGSVARVFDDRDACAQALATPDGLDTYLLAGLAEAAADADLVAGDTEVLSFRLPPVLGGAIEVANLHTVDFVVGVDLAGQLHQQVRDLPPGTTISGFTIE